MNKKIVLIIVIFVAGLLLFKAFNDELNSHDIKNSSSDNSDVNLQNIPLDKSNISEELTQSKSKKALIISESFLNNISEEHRVAYTQVNERLFGILDNISEEDYQALIEKGFPSTNDIEFVSNREIVEVSSILYSNVNKYPSFDTNPSLSYHALSSLNLLEALADLEDVTRYYFPDYQQGAPFPKRREWPNGERPSQVVEAMSKIVAAGSVVMDESAIELLAQARYQQFAFNSDDNNSTRVVEKLAMANKLLKGNNNLLIYVKQYYPENFDLFNQLSSE